MAYIPSELVYVVNMARDSHVLYITTHNLQRAQQHQKNPNNNKNQ